MALQNLRAGVRPRSQDYEGGEPLPELLVFDTQDNSLDDVGVRRQHSSFGLFYLGDRVLDLGHPRVQTLIYLMLSVAGHLTIFLTRTRGPLWSIRPARILLIAVFGTHTVATVIAVYRLFMAPLGWKWAALVWAYALVWALLSDRIKLLV